MAIKVYNTLTKKKEELIPLEPKRIGIYNCGPTVYDYFHIGNARNFIVIDVIRRYLEYRGYQVRLVQNFTDIDDKIINRAKTLGISCQEVAQKYIRAYYEDAFALGILPADVYPRATDHIPEMLALITKLIEKGYAYVKDGSVYFSVRKFPDYTKLSGKNIDELIEGARVEVDENKEDPLDFALWKKSKPEEPIAYNSPWGLGRPGWHIECSAMSMRYLGETFDIHSGGIDLIFPHHTNEIAQSQAATGRLFAKYWIHNGFVNIGGEKMSKSLGNILLVRELLKKYPGEVIRLFILSAHYRSPLDFSEKALEEHAQALMRVYACLQVINDLCSNFAGLNFIDSTSQHELVQNTKDAFISAMDDDFNTAKALGAVFELVNTLNQNMASSQPDKTLLLAGKKTIQELGNILGLFQEKEFLDNLGGKLIPELIQILIDIRQTLRERRDYALADTIRSRLQMLNIALEDRPGRTTWRRLI